jgi:hypothetical protein
MKIFSMIALSLFSLSLVMGCTSTASKEEKEAYFEEGKMEEQVQSWEKHGRY